jgi:hypothetical protein
MPGRVGFAVMGTNLHANVTAKDPVFHLLLNFQRNGPFGFNRVISQAAVRPQGIIPV